jgi:dihydrofolate synthase/folylpolyglutamate synthase
VGAYTSPHILRYSERIKINGIPVSDDEICAAFSLIDEARGDTTLSYFEFSTLASLLIFSQARVAIQILEVGLGGRLDAVNIVDADVAIVTSIAIDHVEWLGKTRDKIGYEKAGIFRPNKPAIVGEQNPPQTLVDHAAHVKADIFRIGDVYNYSKNTQTWTWQSTNR